MLHKIKKDLPEAAKRSLTEAKERRAIAKKMNSQKNLEAETVLNQHVMAIGRKKGLFLIFD